MKSRLLDLLRECRGKHAYLEEDYGVEYVLDKTADDLLDNGVIALPFPIGTIYYRVIKRCGKHVGEHYIIREVEFTYATIGGVLRDFGNMVFLTREDADKRIKDLLYGEKEIGK